MTWFQGFYNEGRINTHKNHNFLRLGILPDKGNLIFDLC